MSRFHVMDGEQLEVLKTAISQLRTYILAVDSHNEFQRARGIAGQRELVWISVGGDKTPEQLADDAEEVLRVLEEKPKL